MDRKTIEEKVNLERKLSEVDARDPGPVAPETKRSPHDRYDTMGENALILAKRVQSRAARSDNEVQTPKLEVLPATAESPAVMLHLAVKPGATETSPLKSITARWEYAEPPAGKSLVREEDRVVQKETFSRDLIGYNATGQDPNRFMPALNRLEQSVAAYIEAFNALSDEQRLELDFNVQPQAAPPSTQA